MNDLQENFYYSEIQNMYLDYVKVKEAIIVAENLDPQKRVYVAPLNQLRSALDHIMKASVTKEKDRTVYELVEARSHINRAGSDAFEIVSTNLGLSIGKKLEKYSIETLTKVFPEYFQKIKPEIQSIKVELGKIRTNNNTDTPENKKSLADYWNEVQRLLEINTQVDYHIPALNDFTKKLKKEKVKDKAIGFLIGLLIGLLLLVAKLIIDNGNKISNPNYKVPKVENPLKQQKSD